MSAIAIFKEILLKSQIRLGVNVDISRKLSDRLNEQSVTQCFSSEDIARFELRRRSESTPGSDTDEKTPDPDGGDIFTEANDEIEGEAMAMTNVDFLGIATRTINRNYV